MKRTHVIHSGSVLLLGVLLAGCSTRARGQGNTAGGGNESRTSVSPVW